MSASVCTCAGAGAMLSYCRGPVVRISRFVDFFVLHAKLLWRQRPFVLSHSIKLRTAPSEASPNSTNCRGSCSLSSSGVPNDARSWCTGKRGLIILLIGFQ